MVGTYRTFVREVRSYMARKEIFFSKKEKERKKSLYYMANTKKKKKMRGKNASTNYIKCLHYIHDPWLTSQPGHDYNKDLTLDSRIIYTEQMQCGGEHTIF